MAIRTATRATGTVYIAYFKYQGRQNQKTWATKREARAWEAEEKKRLKALAGMAQNMLYSQACEAYLEDCEARMTPGTFAEKQRHLREFAVFMRRDVPAESVQALHVRQFLLKIKEKHGNKSANRRLRTLKALWNWHKERLPHNPWRGIPSFAEEEYVKYVPSAEDVSKVLEVAKPWQREILDVLLHTGARISEVLKLRWADVSEQALQLWTQKRKNGSKERRVVPLDATLKSVLAEVRERTGEREHVFLNPLTDAPFTIRQPVIRYMLQRLCAKAEVEAFGFHALRHYFAMRLMKSQKTGLTDIQMLLGHQRATTTDTYLRSMSPQLDYLADIIEEAIQAKP